jgi:hypothetical protein
MKNQYTIRTVLLIAVVSVLTADIARYLFTDTAIVRAAANFLQAVTHDTTLIGSGTSSSPLGVAANGIETNQLSDGAVTAPKIASGQVVKRA